MNSNSEFFQGGQVGFKFLGVEKIADNLGIPAAPFRFMIGIVLGFPFGLLYLLLPRKQTSLKHFYISSVGLLISYFCFGSDCIFNIISVLVSYVSLILFGGTIQNVMFAFIFQMSYMLGSYIFYSSDGYDVKWTTPQCIMCLRLIGLAWDCYDGKQKQEKLRDDLKKTCYSGTPTFLEIFGYSFFFGAFMAGPQFSFQRYTSFVECKLVDSEGMKTYSRRFKKAIEKLFSGIVILAIFVKLDPLFSADFMYKPGFMEYSFIKRCTYMTLSYHIHFCKYVAIWYLCESVCMITGLSYNGVHNGKSQWDGVCNFKMRKCVTGAFFQDMLESFNINTSQWAGRYVFRRLMFLGNKNLSHILTLAFLSLWHGFYIGYPILFGIEFLLLKGERETCANLSIIFDTTYNNLPFLTKLMIRVSGALFKAYSCAFAASAFMLLRWRRIKVAYGATYYWLIVVFIFWFAILIPLLKIIAKKSNKKIMNQIVNMLYNSSGSVGFHFINISKLASYLGTAEAGLRFLIGLFIGYPLAIQYIHMSKSSANVKHAFFVISGLLINYFVFGMNSIYTLLSVFASWLSFCLFGGTIMNVIIAICFHTIYLSVGYATSASSSNYDVKWTTPQCMLCLRLIGLAWDVYDGLQNPETLSEDQKKNCVKTVPKILELFGFSYCFCGFLSGPQFSYRRYIAFVNEELIDKSAKRIRFS